MTSSPSSSGAPVWFLVGPTASGKNAGAIELARELDAEVLVLDSMKVYRGMDVGTAKPDAAMRGAVPHHLLDLVDPCDRFDIHQYLAHAEAALADLDARGKTALFVGGTHLYLGALLRGMWSGPPPDEALRAELEAREGLWDALREVDPASAERIHPNDRKRLIRALEVFRSTGRPLSAWQQDETRPHLTRPYRGIRVARRREQLYDRIDRRVDQMLASGWVDEVRRIEGGPGFGRQAGMAIGYRELREALASGTDPLATREAICLRTHNFARKQLNWLARFEELAPVELSGTDREGAVQAILASARALAAGPPELPRAGRWLR